MLYFDQEWVSDLTQTSLFILQQTDRNVLILGAFNRKKNVHVRG